MTGGGIKPSEGKFIFHASQMPEFVPKSQQWDEWKERLEIHFAEIGATEEPVQRSTLLKAIGTEPYKMLRALCDPEIPAKKTYAELCALLSTHFMPPVILYRERLNFYTANKNSDESVTEWYARCKTLALSCKFGDSLENYVRDKFMTGMANEEKNFRKIG